MLGLKKVFSLLLLTLAPQVLAETPSQEALRFSALAAKSPNGVIKLNVDSFDAITAAYRDWSVAIQLTALGSEFKCAPCKTFDPNYNAVSKAWTKVPKKDRDFHFFATVDFSEGREIFTRLGLTSAPFVRFYPATAGPHVKSKTDTWNYDFNSNEFEALTLAEQLSRSTPAPIPYSKPLNYNLIASVGATFLFTLLIARSFWFFFSGIIFSRWLWGLISISVSLVMCGGFMFVRIRSQPLGVQDRNGGSIFVASGFQSQYGMETWIISALYGALGFSFIALTLLVPKIGSPGRQRAGVYLWTTAMMIIYSLLISLFRVKNPGYPFGLFF